MTAHELHIDIPAGWWWSANDRRHWADKAARTKAIRRAAEITARNARLPVMDKVHVCAWIGYPRGGKADPHNVASTVVKAALDGLTDAGLWADDDSSHVVAVELRRDKPSGRAGMHTLRLTITPQEVPW